MWALIVPFLLPSFSCSRLAPAVIATGSAHERGHGNLSGGAYSNTELLASRLRHVASSSSSQPPISQPPISAPNGGGPQAVKGLALRPDGEQPPPPRVAAEVQAPTAREEAMSRESPEVSTGRDEAFFDWFFFAYWGSCTVVFAISVWLLAIWREKIKERRDSGEEEEEEEPEPYELSENLWSLNLISALGQVRFGNGELCPAIFVAAISLMMGCLQLTAIALMVGAIDPNAEPVTKRIGSPWLQDANPFPVNLMKWCMATFLTVGQVGEVAQCRKLVTQTLLVNPKRLLVPRWLPLMAAALQYSVSISVVWAGVAVILCFQTVPDIIYSSMSVFFITSADEMFFECIQTIFDLEAEWSIDPNSQSKAQSVNTSRNQTPRESPQTAAGVRSEGAGAALGGDHPDHHLRHAATSAAPSARGESDSFHPVHFLVGTSEPMYMSKDLPDNVWWILKVFQLLPMAFGFFVLSRSFYTGVMPTKRFHAFGLR